MIVENLDKLTEKLNKKIREATEEKGLSVVVGFSAPHAVFVHENTNPVTLGQNVPRPSGIGVYWGPPQYGPKYLETPTRELAPEMRTIIRENLKDGVALRWALHRAGKFLEGEAQKNVPIEHGDLHDSAFTEIVKI